MSNNYEMSDEDFAKLDLNDLEEETPEEEEEESLDEQPEEEDEYEESEEADNESETEADDEEYLEEQETSEEEEDSAETDTNVEDNDDQEEVTPEEVGSENETEDSEEQTEDEYKNFYDELTAPFKAAGKEVQISNPEDIKALMQQGISYSQKMAAMKPGLNILRTLDQHNLNDPVKISYLIDLHNKKPEAIAKLIKDSEIDIYDFDAEEKSTNYIPDSKVRDQTKLEEVVNELSTSEGFSEVFNTISTEWDVASRQAIIDNPGLLKIIQAQKESGAYDRIVEAVAHERMLGRLTEVNYIDAYVAVEQGMYGNQEPVQEKPKQSFKASRPKPKATNNSGKKRKVASPTSGGTKGDDSFNPLEISDEELLQIMNQNSKY